VLRRRVIEDALPLRIATEIQRFVHVLQYTPVIVPTHSNECIGVSRSYDKSILEHVGVCDANKSQVSDYQTLFVVRLSLSLTFLSSIGLTIFKTDSVI